MLTEPWLIPVLSLIMSLIAGPGWSPLCGARKDWNDKLLISLGTKLHQGTRDTLRTDWGLRTRTLIDRQIKP